MDPMEVLLRRKKDEASMQALTNGLRRQKEISQISTLSGDPILGKFGAGLGNEVDSQVKLKTAMDDKQAQRDMTQGYYDQMASAQGSAAEHRGKVLTETIRHNKEMEDVGRLKAGDARLKAPSVSAQKRTTEATESYQGIQKVVNSFKDEYANNTAVPFEGKLSNTLGKYGMGSEGQKDQSRWWADYDLLYTLGRRNKLFGSALTDSEIRAWEGANISPNSPPDVIKRGLATLTEIANRKLQEQYANDQSLYRREWVDSIYAPYMGGQAPDPTGAPSDPTGAGVQDWGTLK